MAAGGEDEEMKNDCRRCKHFYRVMATESGYNPFPSCQRYADTGKHPNIITRECFEKRRKTR